MAQGHEIALARDMTFEKIMHRNTATTHEGFSAMLNKDKEAQRAAVAEYFQHWDNKEAKNETEADREVSSNLRQLPPKRFPPLSLDHHTTTRLTCNPS